MPMVSYFLSAFRMRSINAASAFAVVGGTPIIITEQDELRDSSLQPLLQRVQRACSQPIVPYLMIFIVIPGNTVYIAMYGIDFMQVLMRL